MSYDDRVLSLFADANPVPDDASLDELTRPSLTLIEQGEDTMSDTDVRHINTGRPIVRQERNRRLLYGAAAAVLALVVGTVGWVQLTSDQASDDAAAGAGDFAVIETFYRNWSEGRISRAMALVAPQDWVDGDPFLQPTMEYVASLEPDGWFWSVTDCVAQVPGTYSCRLELVGDPLLEAMGLSSGRAQVEISEGRLKQVGIGAWAAAADQRLSTYARQQDPAGYETACVGSNGRAMERNGVVYNAACGTFLSEYLEPLAAELTAP